MNLLFFLTIILSFYMKDFKKIAWFGFFAAIIWDIVFVNIVGLTSLGLLTISFLIYLYRQKFSSSHLLFQLFFVITSYSIIIKLQNLTWQWQNALILILSVFVIYNLSKKFKFSKAWEMDV